MDPIKDFLEIVKPAKAQTHRNLTLFPLMAPESGDPDYLTLEEALRAEAVVINRLPGEPWKGIAGNKQKGNKAF